MVPMKINDRHIRQILSSRYESREAANISRILCLEVLGQSQLDYYLGKDMELSADNEEKINSILCRLSQGEPLQYIQGKARFLMRDFIVNPAVLIPRPETEELVQLMISQLSNGCQILDVGTGSGCIAISLALELKGAKVTGWDISSEALQVARKNASFLHASVDFLLQDVFTFQPSEPIYDVIVSNPPYVCRSESASMTSQVLEWEPHDALFVPDDNPLLFYRQIGQLGLQLLHRSGKLYFEINQVLGADVKILLESMGYRNVQLCEDIYHNHRFVIANI